MAKTSKWVKIVWLVLAGFAVNAALHLWLNVGFEKLGLTRRTDSPTGAFRVGFLPVTCHLTCPVTDWINRQLSGGGFYEPVRFSGFPEIKEAVIAGHLPATFMLAPLAMALRQQGVPIKVVYLGHRDGTAMMVRKESNLHRLSDLKGKTIAVPNRFSNQYLILYKGLKEAGLSFAQVRIVEMPPPDMPAALFAQAVDAIIAGEPFMAQTQLEGYGRVLFQAKELWPNFISCVLAVHESAIQEHPEWVQQLVDGIARSGQWLEAGMDHRMQAAETVAQRYYNQHPRLLQFVLSTPPDRVRYGNLALARADFEQIERLAREAGILDGSVGFNDYADPRFSARAPAPAALSSVTTEPQP